MLHRFSSYLSEQKRRGTLRSLSVNQGINFSSNDFLGLSTHPRMLAAIEDAISRGIPVGSSGSRLLRGNHPEHEALECEAARFFKSEKSLYFSSGYAANTSLLSCLPTHGDVIIFDELVHASLHEGLKLSKAEARAVEHNCLESFSDEIKEYRAKNNGRIWLVVESLYSMDGDRAPLKQLIKLAQENEAFIIIDEAHATGIFGENGRGLAAKWHYQENVICVHTCGKALGASGALVCASGIICDFLINQAKSFIYSTAPSPIIAACVRESLRILIDEPQRNVKLAYLVKTLGDELKALAFPISGSHIQPIILGDTKLTMSLSSAMSAQGYDVRGIRPPTVPINTSRLRISISLHVQSSDISKMVDVLVDSLEDLHQ